MHALGFVQGVRRAEQTSLIDMYKARTIGCTLVSTNTALPISSSLPSMTRLTSQEPGSSRIRKLEKLIKKRL